MHDFSKYKFRCSALGNIMTNARSGEGMGETVKKYLLDIYIKEVFNREYDIETKYTDKGLLVEENGIALAQKYLDRGLLIKNKEQLQNDFITGTPDLILDDLVVDIKSSWDLKTFGSADGTNKLYYWQLQGYMYLTGKRNATLVYCLCDTPEHLIQREVSRQVYRTGYNTESEEYLALEAEIEHNLTFGDIEDIRKVKGFDFTYNEADIEALQKRIVECRQYLNNIVW